MQLEHGELIQGDCLEIIPTLPDQSVDLVLCDPPYGVTPASWDKPLPMEDYIQVGTKRMTEMEFYTYGVKHHLGGDELLHTWKANHRPGIWSHYDRILRPGDTVVIFGAGDFTSKLIVSAKNARWRDYRLVWDKCHSTGHLSTGYRPMHRYEDICVFYKKKPTYNPQFTEGKPYSIRLKETYVNQCYDHYKPASYENRTHRHPSDIIQFINRKKNSEHISQKPLELARYLIRTYSNPGAVMLDHCCGSGTFLVAAQLEDRRFIGIEQSELFIETCQQRLATETESKPEVTAEEKPADNQITLFA